MFFTYIIQSQKNNSLYIGSTTDTQKRLSDHNNGRSYYTKKLIPWILVYKEEYQTKSEALVRERQLKKWKNKKRILELIRRNKYSPSN